MSRNQQDFFVRAGELPCPGSFFYNGKYFDIYGLLYHQRTLTNFKISNILIVSLFR